MLIAKPPSMPWPVAAGVPEVWITALQALSVVGEFSSGKSVLWHAGASSVSVAGIQISKALGATAIYATVGSDEKVRFCESLGATKAWNYSSRNWEVELRKETDGKGVDIIVDFIGQKYWQMNLNSTALDGRIVILGLLSGGRITAGEDGNTLVDLTPLVHKRLRVEGSLLRSRSLEYQRLLRDRLVQDLLPRFVDGTFQVPIERVFDWTEIQDAHSLMESNTIKGKVVCQVT
jgi:NADPH:quinone reductase-like Zn-dependent oxidoreductase